MIKRCGKTTDREGTMMEYRLYINNTLIFIFSRPDYVLKITRIKYLTQKNGKNIITYDSILNQYLIVKLCL